MNETINNKRSECFFCSEIIEEKKTLEHIIPDSLLGKLGIKQEILATIGRGAFLYSRIKVPAHKKCNSTFGSEYEDKVMKYFESPSELYLKLVKEEDYIPERYSPNSSTTMILSTWLSKIYYGLFYNDYLKIKDIETKEIAKEVIQSKNFEIVRQAYKEGVGFCMPLSLFVFESSESYFDIKTMIQPQTIMVKIGKLIFVLCIGDGFLVKNYLNEGVLKKLREYLKNQENIKKGFPSHLFALAEITALRMNIPKSPSFTYSNKEIVNLSFFTLVNNPNEYYKMDDQKVLETRKRIIKEFINIENAENNVV